MSPGSHARPLATAGPPPPGSINQALPPQPERRPPGGPALCLPAAGLGGAPRGSQGSGTPPQLFPPRDMVIGTGISYLQNLPSVSCASLHPLPAPGSRDIRRLQKATPSLKTQHLNLGELSSDPALVLLEWPPGGDADQE
ncbi:uncharacterized protein LOC127677451 [Apodemus sylvaticus]|uniref:uncharacterized protein LOC127677451 n=1 Tax=Apodemus sylvaticus TaxID=10129 RepID=UPI002243A990|nr:uncharacterized protein LOC127677451 [Apodemus sylvaticus]